MKILPGLFLGMLLAFAVAAQDVVIEHVNVIPMNREIVLRDQSVLVKDGRFVEVGAAGKLKDGRFVQTGALRVDGKGKYLMPGMGEMHGHIPPPTSPAQDVEDVLFLYVANGITTVRGMLGYEGQLEIRDKARRNELRNELVAPSLYLAGPSFNGATVKTAAQAVERVKQQKAEGWDLLKIHPGVPLAAYDAMAATAKAVGMRFGGHVPADVGILHALESKQETIDHLDGYLEHLDGLGLPIPDAQMVSMARKTKASGAAVVPTMALWATIIGARDATEVNGYPELQYMPKWQVSQWKGAFAGRQAAASFSRSKVDRVAQDRKRLLKIFYTEGVKILFGTDAPQQFSVPGFSMHRELQAMAEVGMKPYDILRSGTVNVGEYFQGQDRFGVIAAGQRADAVLLEGNPLEDVGNLRKVAGVLLRGKWLAGSEIAKRLEGMAARRQ